jgi:hypothetical protein
MNKLSSVLQVTVLKSVMLWAVLGVSVQAEEKKLTLPVELHGQTIEINYSEEQNPGSSDFFYAMWVKEKARCSADVNDFSDFTDIKQPPKKGDFLCVLRTKENLGEGWKSYAIMSADRSMGDDPTFPLPEKTSPKPPKIKMQKCELKTSATSNTETCTLKF